MKIKCFKVNCAKPYIGKAINIKTDDGTVFVNYILEGIENKFLLVRPNKPGRKADLISLYKVVEITALPYDALRNLQENSPK